MTSSLVRIGPHGGTSSMLPFRVSSPPRPKMRSSPQPPYRWLKRGPPLMTSSYGLPRTAPTCSTTSTPSTLVPVSATTSTTTPDPAPAYEPVLAFAYSLSGPPRIVSSPGPASNVSGPIPPNALSTPPPSSRWSLPARPSSSSSPAPPSRSSLP